MDRPANGVQKTEMHTGVFGRKAGLWARVFACKHRMSRPVTTGEVTYKYCASCGIRREYDPITFESGPDYYYPAIDEKLHHV
ncbi:MAG: hypothetical protein OEM82_07445 [Acidobacteriota bacterium]|nr:hypothetical protein [Acidobacteriota bacterium]MDH3528035.1 hypothetical protein [Acidobacteriota bacterium]